ncbi:adenosylmethionine decarboxylase [Amycolatopsis cihanbeyliensis]|uniref:S-adenosylmethionine decarboxylase proenzyme n=1 Tax=Amycolatopsis cihanbeyliensis TaxID=1128664 RepID=A0A542DDN9_AMYCI|nr:adenosylmethionine decarboxylase [Amycolatopsis cihanbeyliensis]TQJ01187.1 S-adenosylmethionine decarboxylase [Amycolatopsis cihanbeyliensis]
MRTEYLRPPIGAFAGRHVLAELEGIPAAALDDVATLRDTLATTLSEAGATVCDVISHRFQPQGVTVLAMLAESHASLHTYPEIGAVFVDVFTCGERADPERAAELLASKLGAASVRMSTVDRGHQPATQGS